MTSCRKPHQVVRDSLSRSVVRKTKDFKKAQSRLNVEKNTYRPGALSTRESTQQSYPRYLSAIVDIAPRSNGPGANFIPTRLELVRSA